MRTERVLIMGAAGRDFHDFNVVYRDDPSVEVVAFTATQIPGIADRRYPAALAGERYPEGIPIRPEGELETLIRDLEVDTVVFAYSDVSHEQVMHAASRALAAGADFKLLGPNATLLESTRPVVSVCAVRTGCGKSQTSRHVAVAARGPGPQGRGRPPPDAVRRPRRAALPALRDLCGPGPPPDDDRGARGVRAASRCRAARLRGRGLRGHPAGRGGRGRRGPLGRRQQRPAVLQARPGDRRGGPAPPGPRAALPPRRGQPAQRGRDRHQQGRLRHARGPGPGAGEHRRGEPGAPRSWRRDPRWPSRAARSAGARSSSSRTARRSPTAA